jgi:hypothetical protein
VFSYAVTEDDAGKSGVGLPDQKLSWGGLVEEVSIEEKLPAADINAGESGIVEGEPGISSIERSGLASFCP